MSDLRLLHSHQSTYGHGVELSVGGNHCASVPIRSGRAIGSVVCCGLVLALIAFGVLGSSTTPPDSVQMHVLHHVAAPPTALQQRQSQTVHKIRLGTHRREGISGLGRIHSHYGTSANNIHETHPKRQEDPKATANGKLDLEGTPMVEGKVDGSAFTFQGPSDRTAGFGFALFVVAAGLSAWLLRSFQRGIAALWHRMLPPSPLDLEANVRMAALAIDSKASKDQPIKGGGETRLFKVSDAARKAASSTKPPAKRVRNAAEAERVFRQNQEKAKARNKASTKSTLSTTSKSKLPKVKSYKSMDELKKLSQRRDYLASVGDKDIFRLPPDHELMPEEVVNVFDYPRILFDKYQLKEKIGEGTFGTVTKAIGKTTGRIFACKSIPKVPTNAMTSNPHHLLKIRAEVDSMDVIGASLDAVYLKDAFEDNHCVHLVMELCDGGSLIETIMAKKLLPEERAAELVRSILRFIAQCHSKGLIYRDVKPGNFLFVSDEPNSPLKATDFGLMIPHTLNDEPLRTRAGTPVYLAPEVVKRNYNAKADMYSIGIVMWQLLTGRFPYWPTNKFKAPSMIQLFSIISEPNIDFDSLDKEGVGSDAKDLLKKLLEIDPEKRITATEALEHPWIKEKEVMAKLPLGGTVIQRLQRFAINGFLKQHSLNMICKNILQEEDLESRCPKAAELIEPLRRLFSSIDTDGSGDVSLEELVDGLKRQGYNLTLVEVEQLLSRMDVNKDGEISFDEFVTCLLSWSEIQREEYWSSQVKKVFDSFDLDGDGEISRAEVEAMLPPIYVEEQKRTAMGFAIMRECDMDGDGLIGWEEFWRILDDSGKPDTIGNFDRRFSLAVEDPAIGDAVADAIENEIKN